MLNRSGLNDGSPKAQWRFDRAIDRASRRELRLPLARKPAASLPAHPRRSRDKNDAMPVRSCSRLASVPSMSTVPT